MLNEISQTPKDKIIWFNLHEVPEIVKFTQKVVVITRAKGRGSGELLFSEYRIWGNENILEMVSGWWLYNSVNVPYATELYT